jgi:hyperosmotically inducible periplasmic protein
MESDLRTDSKLGAEPEPERRDDPTLIDASYSTLRSRDYRPRKRRWPGVLVALLIAAGIGGLVVSNLYEDRTVGQRLDDTIGATQQTMRSKVDGVRDGMAQTGERVANRLGDAGITAAIKTALAADPVLSALQIDVSTRDGVVTLEGPAPNQDARSRASVLASAPTGVEG